MKSETLSILDDFTHQDKYLHPRYNEVRSLHSYDYLLVTEKDGEEIVHTRINQPCYGEMRIYPTKWKPGDLHDPFPDGKPIGVAVRLKHFSKKASPGWKYTFSEDSLWYPILKDRVILTESKKDSFDGIIMKDLDIDSDYWFSLLLSFRMIQQNEKLFVKLTETGVSPLSAWIASMLTQFRGGTVSWNVNPNYYSMAYPSSFKNLLNREPLQFQEGLMSDRATIRQMPDNMASRIWKGDDTFRKFKGASSASVDEFAKEYIPFMESHR